MQGTSEEPQKPRHPDPELPEGVTGAELDEFALTELRTLPKDLATRVARHLVMAGRLVDDDTEAAYLHARAARRLASRVGIVREACGLAAYHAGEWAEALAELRAARRLAGREDAYLPIIADCERGLGRPERALDIAKSEHARKLDAEDRIELRIVESGARRDLGQYEAAVVTLQIPELKDNRLRPWSARLFYAYADALVEAGREGEARDWFARASAADRDGDTDAAERYAELDGLEIIDTEDDDVAPADLLTGAVAEDLQRSPETITFLEPARSVVARPEAEAEADKVGETNEETDVSYLGDLAPAGTATADAVPDADVAADAEGSDIGTHAAADADADSAAELDAVTGPAADSAPAPPVEPALRFLAPEEPLEQ